MKFLLVEAITQDVANFITNWQEYTDDLSRFFNVKNGKFKKVGSFIEYLVQKDTSKSISILKNALELTESDNEFGQYKEYFLEGLLRIQYPNLSKDEILLKIMTSSLEEDGYKFGAVSGEDIHFNDPFFRKFIPILEKSVAEDNLQLASILLRYKLNHESEITDENFESLIDNASKWFEAKNPRDISYKLDVYVWLSDYNKQRYGLPETISFESRISPDEPKLASEKEKGVVFGELDAKSMRNWLNQFKREGKLTFYDFLYTNNKLKFDDFKSTYFPKFSEFAKSKKDGVAKLVSIFDALKKLDQKVFEDILKQIKLDSLEERSIYNAFIAYCKENKIGAQVKETSDSDPDEQEEQELNSEQDFNVTNQDISKDVAQKNVQQPTKQTTQQPTQEPTQQQSNQQTTTSEPAQTTTAAEEKLDTGLQVMKKVLKIKPNIKTIKPERIQAYVEELARKNKLYAKVKQIKDWNKLYKVLQQPLKYVKEIKGSDVSALNTKIVNYLRKI